MTPPAPAAPPVVMRVAEAVRARLRSMPSDEADPRDPTRRRYAAPPGAVALVEGFQTDMLRPQIGVQYLLMLGEYRESAHPSSRLEGEIELFLLVSQPSSRPSDPYAEAAPIVGQVEAMLADARNRLHSDPRLGGLADALATPHAEHVDVDLAGRPWAVGLMHVVVSFTYSRGAA